jgi:hypothetical protein
MTYCRELTQKQKNEIVKKITNESFYWKGNNLYFDDEVIYTSDNAQAIIDALEYYNKNGSSLRNQSNGIDEYIDEYKNNQLENIKKFNCEITNTLLNKVDEVVDERKEKVISHLKNGVVVGGLYTEKYEVKQLVKMNNEWYYEVKTRSKNNLLHLRNVFN